MSKRDYVSEILSRRSRQRRRGPRHAQVTPRLKHIIAIAHFVRDTSESKTPFRRELAKYVTIGTVACIEGFFRLAFRDLIDHGSPFRENVAKLVEIKFSLEHVVALQAKKVTFGEFIAHLLPAHSLDDLDRAMSTLIGESFLERLKHVKADYFASGPVSIEDEGLTAAVYRDAKKLFEQRHIFVHELAASIRPSARSLAIDFAAGNMLMQGTDALVDELLSTSSPSRAV